MLMKSVVIKCLLCLFRIKNLSRVDCAEISHSLIGVIFNFTFFSLLKYRRRRRLPRPQHTADRPRQTRSPGCCKCWANGWAGGGGSGVLFDYLNSFLPSDCRRRRSRIQM